MAQSARLRLRRNGGEELPRFRGQGGVAGRGYPMPPRLRPGAAAGRRNPTPEARGSGQEDQPPSPRSGGCEGAGGPRGAIPR